MANVATMDRVSPGGKTKIERYGWQMVDERGKFMQIDKRKLKIDPSYQRVADESKVKRIAAEWSWMSLGVLLCGFRGDEIYVYEGGHRYLASLRRADIDELPCMVFKTKNISEEAEAFLRVNNNRKTMDSVSRFRAQLVVGDPIALKVDALTKSAGRIVSKSGADGAIISSIRWLYDWTKDDAGAVERAWPTIVELCRGRTIHENLLTGLFYIESRLNSESINAKRWRNRILHVGYDDLLAGTRKASAFYERGGAKVWATGILQVLNKGLRNKLTVDTINVGADE